MGRRRSDCRPARCAREREREGERRRQSYQSSVLSPISPRTSRTSIIHQSYIMLVRETTAMRAAAAVSSRRRPLAVRAARTQDVVSSTTTSRDNKNRQNTSGAGAGVVQKFLSRQHLSKDFTKQLKISESYWNGMKRGGGGQGKAKTVVEQMPTTAPTALHGLVDYDVCVCGGNLGIAIALALQKRGYRVLIIERRLLRGRTQEWNASRREMRSLIRTGLLTESEVEDAIISEFNPNRV